MNTKSYIAHLDYSLPTERITLSNILSDGELSERDLAKISRKLLGEIFPRQKLIASLEPMSSMFMGDRRSEASIFVAMLTRMFASEIARPSEINYVIYAHGNSISAGDPWSLHSDEECINVPYFLQQKMEMANAIVFNVEQECTGSFTAVKIAKLLVEHGEAAKVLILSSNYFELTQKRLMGGSVFIGDGQGLMLISCGPSPLEIIDGIGRTDGKIDSVNSFLDSKNQQTVVDVGSSLIRELLQKHGLSFDDVPLVVPLNTTPFVWTYYAKQLGIPLKKVFFENMGKGGHLGDVDLIRNLRDINSKEQLPNGYLVVYGVATGTSWNALLLKTCPPEAKTAGHRREGIASVA
ncbi:MAG: 3-oxoacyl-[acyl-carrier-protein] synthase III C-terminal domain-containing protein [Candidatus Sulfotelmatobacter sp.]